MTFVFESSLLNSRSSGDCSASPLDTEGVDRYDGLLDKPGDALSRGSSSLFKRAMSSGSTDDSTCLAPKGLGHPGCGDSKDSSASLDRHLDICLGVEESASADAQSGSAVPSEAISTVVSSIVSAPSVLFSLIEQISSKAALSVVVVSEIVSRLLLRASISSFLLSASSSAVTNFAASRRTLSTAILVSNTPSIMIGLDCRGFGFAVF